MTPLFLLFQTATDALPSKWRIWPFNSGVNGDWETSIATYAFSALILGAICVFLRLLYGPKGIWRDKDMDREADEIRRRQHAELDAQFRAGRISEGMYRMKKKEIDA
jgi:uncharacterized membrane protein